MTLPVHTLSKRLVTDQASDRVNHLAFNNLNYIIAFGDQANDQANDQVSDQARDQAKAIIDQDIHAKVQELLSVVQNWIKRADLFAKMNLSNHSTNRAKYLDPLINIGWVEMEHPESPTHPYQRYRATRAGNRILKMIGTA